MRSSTAQHSTRAQNNRPVAWAARASPLKTGSSLLATSAANAGGLLKVDKLQGSLAGRYFLARLRAQLLRLSAVAERSLASSWRRARAARSRRDPLPWRAARSAAERRSRPLSEGKHLEQTALVAVAERARADTHCSALANLTRATCERRSFPAQALTPTSGRNGARRRRRTRRKRKRGAKWAPPNVESSLERLAG